MIQNHKLLIDQQCPMCTAYATTFTKLKMIDDKTIAPYQTIDENHTQYIDMHRATNEIALHNIETKETKYGLDAMFHIVSQGQQWIKSILYFPLLFMPLKYLYKLITYNRKVIVRAVSFHKGERVCNPDKNLFYRSLFIGLSAWFTAVVLNSYFSQIGQYFGYESPWYVEYFVCFGQIVWQGIMIQFISPAKSWDYLGNMSTVSVLGGILLLPVLLLNRFIHLNSWVLLSVFGLVVGVMLLEHVRRCKSIGLGWWPTISWVLYRNLILLLFFEFILL